MVYAVDARLAESLFCKQDYVGSTPTHGSNLSVGQDLRKVFINGEKK